jgi:steroid delta-isomerase-like uncharacterized protein
VSEQNKALVRRFYEEVFNKQHVNAIDELCTPDFVDHTAMPGQGPGREGFKQSFALFMPGFPDFHATIEDMVAEGDVVVTRFTGTATHKGEVMGAAATNKRVTFHGIDWLKFKDGKVAEAWHQGDDMMVMASLGAKMPG